MEINVSFFTSVKKLCNEKKVLLIAVSKFQSIEKIQSLHQLGQNHFGENYVQEVVDKAKVLPKEIIWHFIGHLQTNKVKELLPFITYIHSVDSLKLLDTIQKNAVIINKKVKILLQLKIATEESKYGLTFQELEMILTQFQKQPDSYSHIQICGLMGMSSLTDNLAQIEQEFIYLKNSFNDFKNKFFYYNNHFTELSMGMSSDYELAILHNSTMVRIGSSIFGNRPSSSISHLF